MDAASRDFTYDEYVRYHESVMCLGGQLSEVNYQKIVDILNTDMDEYFNSPTAHR